MENTKKRSNAYAKLFSFFKSKAVRNIVSAALLICSLFTMLIIDKENFIRNRYFSFLNDHHITDIFEFFKIESFNVMFNAWVIFIALFTVGVILLIGSVFSGAVINSMVSRYSKNQSKSAKVFFGIVYYIVLLIVSAVIFAIFFMIAGLGKVNGSSSGVFLNLVYVLLILLAIIVAIFVAVILAYTVFLMALAVLGFAVYHIMAYAKALDVDGSVFGSKVQVVTVTATENKTAEVKEEITEEKTEEVIEAKEEVIEEKTEEVTEVKDEITDEKTEEVTEVKEEVTEEKTEEVTEVKEETTEEKTVEIIEEVTDETNDEEVENKSAVEEEEISDDFKFSDNASRLKTSFLCRLIQAEKETTDYYSQIKNYILSFKGVNSRISWHCDTFNKGRNQCAKLNIRGKTVIMYIALDPNEYSTSKYHHADVSDKSKYAKTPMMLRIRSNRALKYAYELISIWMKQNDVKQGEVKNVDFSLPYETNEALLERGLIKKV